MKKLKIVLTALAFLLLLAWSCMATWMWIDRSITLTYVGLSNDELFRSKNILGKLILSEWKGMSKKSVRKNLIILFGKMKRNILMNWFSPRMKTEICIWTTLNFLLMKKMY